MALGELKNGIGPDAYAIYQQVLAAVVERDHPVGSLYISESPTSPAELYGGTWERIEGKFIMGASDAYPAGSTGGSKSVILKQSNLPSGKFRVISDSGEGIGITTGSLASGTRRFYGIGGAEPYPYVNLGGNDSPVNTIPPYYSMYIWRRVA